MRSNSLFPGWAKQPACEDFYYFKQALKTLARRGPVVFQRLLLS